MPRARRRPAQGDGILERGGDPRVESVPSSEAAEWASQAAAGLWWAAGLHCPVAKDKGSLGGFALNEGNHPLRLGTPNDRPRHTPYDELTPTNRP
jgi:hypothetical protein